MIGFFLYICASCIASLIVLFFLYETIKGFRSIFVPSFFKEFKIVKIIEESIPPLREVAIFVSDINRNFTA